MELREAIQLKSLQDLEFKVLVLYKEDFETSIIMFDEKAKSSGALSYAKKLKGNNAIDHIDMYIENKKLFVARLKISKRTCLKMLNHLEYNTQRNTENTFEIYKIIIQNLKSPDITRINPRGQVYLKENRTILLTPIGYPEKNILIKPYSKETYDKLLLEKKENLLNYFFEENSETKDSDKENDG